MLERQGLQVRQEQAEPLAHQEQPVQVGLLVLLAALELPVPLVQAGTPALREQVVLPVLPERMERAVHQGPAVLPVHRVQAVLLERTVLLERAEVLGLRGPPEHRAVAGPRVRVAVMEPVARQEQAEHQEAAEKHPLPAPMGLQGLLGVVEQVGRPVVTEHPVRLVHTELLVVVVPPEQVEQELLAQAEPPGRVVLPGILVHQERQALRRCLSIVAIRLLM